MSLKQHRHYKNISELISYIFVPLSFRFTGVWNKKMKENWFFQFCCFSFISLLRTAFSAHARKILTNVYEKADEFTYIVLTYK